MRNITESLGKKELKGLGLLGSFAIYIPAALLMYVLTKYLIP